MDPELITITVKEHTSLREDARFLRALEDAGVANWDGYQHALMEEVDILEWDDFNGAS